MHFNLGGLILLPEDICSRFDTAPGRSIPLGGWVHKASVGSKLGPVCAGVVAHEHICLIGVDAFGVVPSAANRDTCQLWASTGECIVLASSGRSPGKAISIRKAVNLGWRLVSELNGLTGSMACRISGMESSGMLRCMVLSIPISNADAQFPCGRGSLATGMLWDAHDESKQAAR